MDKKLYDHILFMKSLVYTNKQVTDELKHDSDELDKKLIKHDFEFSDIKTLLKQVLFQNKNSLPDRMGFTNNQDTATVVPDKNKAQTLEGWNYKELEACVISNMRSDNRKFYELLIKTKLKVDTDLDLKNFYNDINMSLNAVTKILEDLLTAYHYIKINSEFE